jgi:hypothetical protein
LKEKVGKLTENCSTNKNEKTRSFEFFLRRIKQYDPFIDNHQNGLTPKTFANLFKLNNEIKQYVKRIEDNIGNFYPNTSERKTYCQYLLAMGFFHKYFFFDTRDAHNERIIPYDNFFQKFLKEEKNGSKNQNIVNFGKTGNMKNPLTVLKNFIKLGK